ncbi:MAG: FAD-dependent oxidoreductase [Fibrobacteres bacterium]|nr:FAD-dependent oxidoreductase [Fibrobacterota bacterium]
MKNSYDIVVVGGGPGGIGAAVMAARYGVKTLLVERCGMLGGMAASGEVQPFMRNHFDPGSSAKKHEGWNWGGHEICMDKPVYQEWTAAMLEYLPSQFLNEQIKDAEAAKSKRRMISKDIAALAAEDLCLAAGVELLYHHTLINVEVNGNAIDHLVVSSKSGLSNLYANVYVDCSGDADIAAASGLCEIEMGDEFGNCQPMTLCFKLSNVDKSKMPSPNEIQSLFDKAKADGVLTSPRHSLLHFPFYDNDIIHFNTTRIVGYSGVDGMSLSRAEIEGRRQLREYLLWLRSTIPGFENAMLHSMGQHIGIRETRRVRGLAYLTREDVLKCAKYDDAIARCNYPIDIHSATSHDTEIVHIPHTDFYEIPFGCIIPKGVTNLAIGGRPISADVSAHSSFRIMPSACSIGQAAGVAAAMSSATKCSLPNLDGVKVRNQLINMGAWLHNI